MSVAIPHPCSCCDSSCFPLFGMTLWLRWSSPRIRFIYVRSALTLYTFQPARLPRPSPLHHLCFSSSYYVVPQTSSIPFRERRDYFSYFDSRSLRSQSRPASSSFPLSCTFTRITNTYPTYQD